MLEMRLDRMICADGVARTDWVGVSGKCHMTLELWVGSGLK